MLTDESLFQTTERSDMRAQSLLKTVHEEMNNTEVNQRSHQKKFRHKKVDPVEYKLCCGNDSPPKMTKQQIHEGCEDNFHFHDNPEHICPSHGMCDFCVRPHSEVLKALKAKDYERYKVIRPSLIEHRATVEMEILKAKKEKVPPHLMMERILRHEPTFQKS